MQRRQVRRDEALEGRDKESEVACARGVAGVTIGGQGIVTQPDIMHMKSASPQSLRCTITDKHRILEPRDKRETHPRMVSIASTLIHPDQVSPASASPLTTLMSGVRKTSTHDSSSAKNDVSKRERMPVVEHKAEKTGHSESALRSDGRR